MNDRNPGLNYPWKPSAAELQPDLPSPAKLRLQESEDVGCAPSQVGVEATPTPPLRADGALLLSFHIPAFFPGCSSAPTREAAGNSPEFDDFQTCNQTTVDGVNLLLVFSFLFHFHAFFLVDVF